MTLRQKTSTILRLLLPVLLVSAAVAWSDPVRAAEVAGAAEARCVVQYDGTASALTQITACYLNPARTADYTYDTQAAGSHVLPADRAVYVGTNHTNTSPDRRYVDQCAGGNIGGTYYIGPTTAGSYGSVPDGGLLVVRDVADCSGVYTGLKPTTDSGSIYWTGYFSGSSHYFDPGELILSAIDTNNFTEGFWGGLRAGAVVYPDDWFPGNDPPAPPAATCTDFSFDFEVWPVGPTPGYVPITTPNSWIIYEGDEVRVNVDVDQGVVEDQFEFYSRWSAGDLMSKSSLTVASPSVFPASFERLRSGEAVPFSGFEVGCVMNGDLQNIVTYTSASGWGTAGNFADAPCSSLDYALEVDQGAGWVSLGPIDPVFTGDDFRVNVDNVGSWAVGQLDVAYRTSEVSAFEYLGTMAQGVTVFPVTFTVLDLDERPSFTGSEVEIECSGVGSPSSYWSMGGGFSSFPDDSSETSDGEGCYKLSGLSLTRPTTWVSGAGRMGVCLVDYMVIPDGERVDGYLSDTSDALEGQFPFSTGYLLLDFGQTAVDSIDTAAQCIDLDIDVGSYETPCLATDAVSAGSWRPTLVVIVIGLLLLSVIGLSFELIRK